MISIPTSLNREPGKFVAEPLRDDVQILIQQQIHLVLRYHSLNVFEHNQKIRITVKVALRSWDSLRVYLLRGHCLVSIVSFFFLFILFSISSFYITVFCFVSRSAASDMPVLSFMARRLSSKRQHIQRIAKFFCNERATNDRAVYNWE